MPVINSFIFDGVAPPVGSEVLTGNMNMSISMSATLAKTVRGRSSSDYQIVSDAVASSTSITLSFTAMSAGSVAASRLVVFILGAYLDGSGVINTVTYGGSSCTRAIGSAGGGDKGAAEIWYVNLPTNPANNNLVVTSSKAMISLSVAREVIVGLTSLVPYDTNVEKKNSDQSVDLVLDHPANGISLLGSVLWWGGSSAANCTWPVGGATKSGQGFAASGNEFGFSSAYYNSTTADSNRTFGTVWNGPGSPNQEVCAASWA